MTIDTGTGLPQLPEDHFWRVNQNSVEIRKKLPDTQWRGYDAYNPEGEREDRQVEVTENRSKKVRKFLRKVDVSYEETYRTTEYRYINLSKGLVSAQTEKSGETTVIPGYYSEGYILEHRQPISKENIISTCERALEKFDALNLMGDYPPKKLES